MPQILIKDAEAYQTQLEAIQKARNCDIYHHQRTPPKSYPVLMDYHCMDAIQYSKVWDTYLVLDYVYLEDFEK